MNAQGRVPNDDDAGKSAPVREQQSSMLDTGPTKKPSVPDYELLRRIGHGAYGDVWLARSKATGALRAAKIVWRHKFEDERPFKREFEGIQRFERISREHPSQLALFHIGRNEPAGYFYYVMELADDGSESRLQPAKSHDKERRLDLPASDHLKAELQTYTPHTLRADLEQGRLPAARVLEIGLALTEALSHLHSNGLVHRDVKPSNVIFVNGRPKLADIGLVTDASDQCSIVGTEGYLPPEGPGTPQADIFALGKVLYEAATGLDRREFPKLPEDLRSWPDAKQVFELNEIILKACAQDSEHRYKTCDEMHIELALLGQGKSVRRKRALGRRWVVAKKVLVTASVFGLLTISGSLLWRQSRVTRPLSANPEAERLYHQAVYELKSGALDRLQQAYTNLTEAVKLDPGFVEAYYQMLDVYKGQFAEMLPPHHNQLANLRMVADKLRQLSPRSAQYYTVDSLVKFEEWKFDEAIEEVELALKLEPKKLPRAHGLRGYYVLLANGDADTALREYRIAEQLDPSDVTIETVLAGPFYAKRDFAGAIEQSHKAAQLEPHAPFPHNYLARAYEAKAQLDEAQYDKVLDEYEQFRLLSGRDPEKTKQRYQKLRAILHGDKGAQGLWQELLEEARQNPDAYQIARIYARLGDSEKVFSFLDRAYREHNTSMLHLLEDDAWDRYRSDLRFRELLGKMGFRPKK